MVGRLGADSLAAVSLAVAIIAVPTVVGMGISFALPPLVSEAEGAEQPKKISQYFKHSLVVNLLIGVITCGLIMLGLPLISSLGQEPAVAELATDYIWFSALAMIPMMFFFTFRSYADGMSETLPPMIAMIAGNVINIVLNYAFIFGKWGAPALGVGGAALSSLIARISLQMFFEISAFSGAAVIMGMVSSHAQAAHQIAINISSITFMICTGLAMASTIRVGNQLGKQDYPALRSAGISALFQVTLIMAICSVLFLVFRHVMPLIYIDDTTVIALASYLLIYAAVFQIPDGLQVTALAALRGLQDVKVPTFITFVSYYVFGIPISYFSALHWGLGAGGVWLGLLVGLMISSTLLIYRFDRLSKRVIGA